MSLPLLLSCFSIFLSLSTSTFVPHIVHIVIDDLGWGEVGYHNTEAGDDIRTPVLDNIAATGLQLNRFYTDKMCSPSRSSLQTGRLPIHVNEQNVVPEVCNPADPVGGYQGMPINMTAIAEVLRDKTAATNRYRTYMVGKWDVGMATDMHSPLNRGFDSWLGYWHHSNDYWTQEEEVCEGNAVKDLWRLNATFNGPATEFQNDDTCSQDNQSGHQRCIYEEDILLQEVVDVLEAHDQAQPLFLLFASHLVHMPLQAKQEILDQFSFIEDNWRQLMHAMVNQLDTNIGVIIDTLHRTGMWDNTLLVIHSDNGGEILAPLCGGNNWPLRGGKFSNFEGGIRSTALVTGGVLPIQQRGVVAEGLMSIADWYATYAELAGVDHSSVKQDDKAAAAGLPTVDSISCWAMISGAEPYCRTEIPIGDTSALWFNGDGNALVGGLLQGDFKLLIGPSNKNFWVGQDVITAPLWPNNSVFANISSSSGGSSSGSPEIIPILHPRVCDRTLENGCLFNLRDDQQEAESLAAAMPELFNSMLQRIDEWQQTVYSPVRGDKDPRACETAISNGYYWSPWIQSIE